MTIAADYHAACRIPSPPSDISAQLPTMVDIALRIKAQTVIELGTRKGASTVAWLYAMEENDGHLWSVDIDPPPTFEHSRWTFIQGDDTDQKVVAQLPHDADIVFIDTSHFYAHTVAELNIYRWRVRPGGRIILHDTELRRPEFAPAFPPYPVKRAVEEFCDDERLTWTNHPRWPGLGIIQIPE